MTMAIFWDINQVYSMHIMGYMAISTRHVACDWVTFKDFTLSGSMPHENNDGSLNMHVKTWFAYQDIHNDSGNILRNKSGL